MGIDIGVGDECSSSNENRLSVLCVTKLGNPIPLLGRQLQYRMYKFSISIQRLIFELTVCILSDKLT